jgi:hypothetical protein
LICLPPLFIERDFTGMVMKQGPEDTVTKKN